MTHSKIQNPKSKIPARQSPSPRPASRGPAEADGLQAMAGGQNPKKAVALKYKPGEDNAPQVTAKGTGLVAEKIIDIARKQGIPVKDDPDLVEVLSRLDLEEEIPPELYVIVAELLAFVYNLNRKKASM